MLSKAVLNSEFSFYYSGCNTKPKEPTLPKYLPRAEGEKINLCLYQGHLLKVKFEASHQGFELGSLSPYPETINITLHIYKLV